MRGRYLSPGWLVGHLLVALAVVATGLLGWWQLERASSATGGALNVGYALQWPLFGIFGIYMWVKFLRMESRREQIVEQVEAEVAQASAEPEAAPVVVTMRTRREAAAQLPEEPDEELSDYNRYLAQLNEQDRKNK